MSTVNKGALTIIISQFTTVRASHRPRFPSG